MLDFLNLFRVESRKMFSIGWIIVLLLIAKGSLCYWNVMIIFGRSECLQYFKYLFRDIFSYFDIFREFFLRCFDVTFGDFHGIRYACSVIDNYVNFVG